MKCQNCGADMISGHLYCDICGSEYQIVPNFEPEIEKSIAESLSDIHIAINEDNLKAKDKDFSLSFPTKVPSFFKILICVLILSVFVFLGYFKYTHSVSYQNKQALQAIGRQDYYIAAQMYEKIRKKNDDDAFWYVKEAEVNLLLGKKEAAFNLLETAITLQKNRESAYDALLSLLEEEGNYAGVTTYLKGCEFETLKKKYWEYLCEVPDINFKSGSYDYALEITFEKGFKGNIYYTLDGSIPTKESLKYENPIKLGNGTHILIVVYENEHNVLGEGKVYNYNINSEIPMAPEVTLLSGLYSSASMIEVNVEYGTRVYYTTDLSQPTADSMEYLAPIPLPLGESRFNFIAINEKGITSTVTQRNYMLNMKTNLSLEEAEINLVQKLISSGHILDKNGAIKDRYGVFRYFYKYPIAESELNYYVFEEHYLENQINNPLHNYYAVDVLYGKVYKLIPDDNGNFIRIDF